MEFELLLIIISLALSVFIYAVGAFTMFITGHGWMALAWPYHLVCQIRAEMREKK